MNLVLHPPLTGEVATVRVLVDGEAPGPLAGEDVADGVVRVDSPRMYRLVRNGDVEQRTLTLESESDGVAAFAFTFTSCVAQPDRGLVPAQASSPTPAPLRDAAVSR